MFIWQSMIGFIIAQLLILSITALFHCFCFVWSLFVVLCTPIDHLLLAFLTWGTPWFSCNLLGIMLIFNASKRTLLYFISRTLTARPDQTGQTLVCFCRFPPRLNGEERWKFCELTKFPEVSLEWGDVHQGPSFSEMATIPSWYSWKSALQSLTNTEHS